MFPTKIAFCCTVLLGVVAALFPTIDAGNFTVTSHSNFTIESRIHGGTLTGKAVPYVAALVEEPVANGLVQRCTATYLGDVWVLTAAHCLRGLPWGVGTKTRIYLGTYDARKPVFSAKVIDAMPYPTWSGDTRFGDDVALIQIDKKPNSRNIKPVCLSGQRKVQGVTMTAMGWGRTSCPGRPSWYLKQSQGVGIETCEGKLGDPKKIFSAKFNENGIPDEGDSGGPLFYKSPKGKLIQVGVASTVVVDSKRPGLGCPDPKYPAAYARISEYVTWIKSKYPKVCVEEGPLNKPSKSNLASKPVKPSGGCGGLFSCFTGRRKPSRVNY